MGWRLKHRLFGWHYIAAHFGNSDRSVRVETLPTGRMVVQMFGCFYELDCERLKLVPATKGWALPFFPLTWKPAAVILRPMLERRN